MRSEALDEDRKVEAVLRVLKGEDAAAVASAVEVSGPTLDDWCDRFVRGGTRAVSEDLSFDANTKAMLDGSPDFVFVKDRDHRFLFANHAFASSLGVAPEALVGRLDTEFLEPLADTAFDSFRALDAQVFEGHTARSPRVAGHRDGVLRVFDVHKLPQRDARGDVYAVLTQARDVTEAYQAEEALHASEARYRLLLEHAPVAIYVHDGKRILFGNKAFADLMGAPNPEALLGYPVVQIAHPDEVPKLLARVQAVEAGLVVSPNMEFRAVRLDGGIKPVLVMATKCVYEGQPAIQVVMVDETERLRAQSQREELEAQLRHSQRLESLGTLAGGIAHDFNNMLAVIVTNAELARREFSREQQGRAFLDELLLATDRASALVRGIMTFSRKQPLERAAVQLADVVHEASRLIRVTLPATVALDVDVVASDSGVVADATQVHQVLMNLCTNAAFAIGKAPGRIRIGVDAIVVDESTAREHPGLHPGSYVCVSVGDNGVGMDASTRARVFDPFFTTKGVGAGTGLGLSIVHGIMLAHGGAVSVSSEPGVGTEFRLYFPAAETPSGSVEAPSARDAPSLPSGRHVLLVDDERAVQSVSRQLLERIGFRVTAHSTLAAALAELHENAAAYDLVLTDYSMGDGSGLDLARAARRLRPELPVLLMSGFLDDEVQRQAGDLGVRVFLAKPFSVAQLTSAIDRALGVTPAP